MPRISIPHPEKTLFRTSVAVHIGDINYGNHLANDAVLRICQECRIRWLARHGFTELDAGGTGLIMTDAAVRYLAQARHGDMLDIVMDITGISRSGFTLLYSISRTSDRQAIAAVQTGMVCFDYATQKISRLPAGKPAGGVRGRLKTFRRPLTDMASPTGIEPVFYA